MGFVRNESIAQYVLRLGHGLRAFAAKYFSSWSRTRLQVVVRIGNREFVREKLPDHKTPTTLETVYKEMYADATFDLASSDIPSRNYGTTYKRWLYFVELSTLLEKHEAAVAGLEWAALGEEEWAFLPVTVQGQSVFAHVVLRDLFAKQLHKGGRKAAQMGELYGIVF